MRKDCGTCHFEKKILEEEPCNRCDDNNSEWKSGKIYFAIEEFEKIKAELENPKAISMDFFDGLAYAEEIIDKRISELKGENK